MKLNLFWPRNRWNLFQWNYHTESPYSFNIDNINGDDQVDAVMMSNDVYQGNWSGHEYLNVFVCGAVGASLWIYVLSFG